MTYLNNGITFLSLFGTVTLLDIPQLLPFRTYGVGIVNKIYDSATAVKLSPIVKFALFAESESPLYISRNFIASLTTKIFVFDDLFALLAIHIILPKYPITQSQHIWAYSLNGNVFFTSPTVHKVVEHGETATWYIAFSFIMPFYTPC